MKKLRVYKVEYASCLFRENKQNTYICSNKYLKIGEYVVIEHTGCGIFIGKIIEYEKDYSDDEIKECMDYKFVQKINLSSYLDSLERKKKKEELEEKMRAKFKDIDEKLKFEYYANMDKNFKKLYDEYKSLERND